MKILHLTPGLEIGGAEWMLVHLAAEQVGMGDEVQVVSMFNGSGSVLEDELLRSGVRVSYLGKRLGFDARMFGRIRRQVLESSADIVHTHRGALQYASVLTRTRRQIPIVHTLHTAAEHEGAHGASRFLYRHLGPRLTPVVLSASAVAPAQELFRTRPRVISNGVPVQGGLNSTVRPYTDAPQQVRFVCVARLTREKNHRALLHALADMRDLEVPWDLTLIGDGDERANLQFLCRELQLGTRVHFLGEQSNVSQLLEQQDVFVLPSRREGMPMSVLEAMSARLPVVATDVGGMGDVVVSGVSGVLLPQPDVDGTVEGLTDALRALARDENLRSSLGAAGQAAVRDRYSAKIMARSYKQLYCQVVGVVGT